MDLLRHADRPARPWKNGGGLTRDVITMPDGAGLDTFDWRVSLAEVASDGPFSRFDGIDRTTAILSGAGFILTVDGQRHRLTPDSPGLAYPGDAPAGATLIEGPVTDLNIMSRRGRFAHRLTLLTLETPRAFVTGTALVLWQAGVAQVSDATGSVAPSPLDALLLGGDDHVVHWSVTPEGPVRFWLVEILPA